jgi:hypothetical protein
MKKLSKDTLEILNSLSWFLMDAMWMLSSFKFAYMLIIPTVLSGIILVFKEKQYDGVLISLAAFFWSVMNSIWLVGESMKLTWYLPICKTFFALGIGSLITGIIISNDATKTLSTFKRLRFKKLIAN